MLLVLLLDLYPVKMNTSQNPPSLFFCESGCTLTSCTSHAMRSRNRFPDKVEGEKNKKQHAGYICKFCEFGHTTVPYGIGAQGHAVGTNQRGKGPPIATVMNTPHAHGRKSKNQTAGEPQERKRKKELSCENKYVAKSTVTVIL